MMVKPRNKGLIRIIESSPTCIIHLNIDTVFLTCNNLMLQRVSPPCTLVT